jgi:hypothetical protein
MTQENKNSIQIDGVFLNRRGGCSPRVQQEIEDGFVAWEELHGAAICFEWSGNIGFGEATVWISSDGKLQYDDEHMGIEFIKLLFDKFYECIKSGQIE